MENEVRSGYETILHGYITPETPRVVYEELYNLNYRAEGDMRGFLVKANRGELIAWTAAIFTTRPEYKSGHVKYVELIGWAMVCHDPALDSLDEYHYALNVYVRRAYRKQGYGRKLVDAVEAYNTGLLPYIASPWDENSTVFFKSVGLPISGL